MGNGLFCVKLTLLWNVNPQDKDYWDSWSDCWWSGKVYAGVFEGSFHADHQQISSASLVFMISPMETWKIDSLSNFIPHGIIFKDPIGSDITRADPLKCRISVFVKAFYGGCLLLSCEDITSRHYCWSSKEMSLDINFAASGSGKKKFCCL